MEAARAPRWRAVRSYCDEFECTSSPAVEQTVRALARDLTRLRTWTLSLFAKDVRYRVRSSLGRCPSTAEDSLSSGLGRKV